MKNIILWALAIMGTLVPVKVLDNYVGGKYNLDEDIAIVEWTDEHDEAVKEIDRLMVDLFEGTWKEIEK